MNGARLTLSAAHVRQLDEAVHRLEQPTFAARLADFAAQPVNSALRFMPSPVNGYVRRAAKTAIFSCLEWAVESMDEDGTLPPADGTAKLITGVTGAIGGFFGMAALPFELPLTTTLMMRSIAEIARAQGEDLKTPEALMACVEVFALGGTSRHDKIDADYFAVRAVLTKLTSQLAVAITERGALSASSPIVVRLVAEVASRLGVVVTEIAGARVLPIAGAVGGATVNLIFMDHFQRIAGGHFTIRRLERTYGHIAIRSLYRERAALVSHR